MTTFDVQSVEIHAPFETAFRYIADPRHLPEWTQAFKQVADGRATMATPAGSVEVELRVDASEAHGTIDWTMGMPDGSVAKATSRVIPHGDRSIYTFVLEAPPLPLEQIEGTLGEQSRTLATELGILALRLGSGNCAK